MDTEKPTNEILDNLALLLNMEILLNEKDWNVVKALEPMRHLPPPAGDAKEEKHEK